MIPYIDSVEPCKDSRQHLFFNEANCTLMVQPVTLTVGNETSLLLDAWRDPGGTGHTICARLLNDTGSPLQGQTVTLTVNGTAYTQQTNQSGYVTLHLALQPGDTTANMYQVLATFNGTNPRSAILNAPDPYGDQYAACTTTQYDLRPSTNSSTLAVLLQSTDAITATQTMEGMQKQAEQSGTLRTEPKFGWGYPWFWLQTAVSLSVSDCSLVTCTSLFGGWLESYHDLENPLYAVFSGVAPQEMDIVTSAAISGMTTALATFVGGYIAAKASEWTLFGHIGAMVLYFGVATAVLGLIYALADAHVAKAVLITAGWTLLGLTTLGFTKTIPIFASNFVGGDPVTASIKCIVNTLQNVVIATALLRALGASIIDLLFYSLTFILGIMAVILGYSRA